jgi:hypothetical protein
LVHPLIVFEDGQVRFDLAGKANANAPSAGRLPRQPSVIVPAAASEPQSARGEGQARDKNEVDFLGVDQRAVRWIWFARAVRGARPRLMPIGSPELKSRWDDAREDQPLAQAQEFGIECGEVRLGGESGERRDTPCFAEEIRAQQELADPLRGCSLLFSGERTQPCAHPFAKQRLFLINTGSP